MNLVGDHLVKAICPRCKGNGYVKIQNKEYDCCQCENQMFVMLPANQCRENVEGGTEPRWMKTGETI